MEFAKHHMDVQGTFKCCEDMECCRHHADLRFAQAPLCSSRVHRAHLELMLCQTHHTCGGPPFETVQLGVS